MSRSAQTTASISRTISFPSKRGHPGKLCLKGTDTQQGHGNALLPGTFLLPSGAWAIFKFQRLLKGLKKGPQLMRKEEPDFQSSRQGSSVWKIPSETVETGVCCSLKAWKGVAPRQSEPLPTHTPESLPQTGSCRSLQICFPPSTTHFLSSLSRILPQPSLKSGMRFLLCLYVPRALLKLSSSSVITPKEAHFH